jgi:ribosome-associated protein
MDIKITTEFIKLQQLLKFAGVCSTGAEAKMVILDGLVSVGGEVCEIRGKKMYPGDSCEYNGTKISVL